MGSMPRFLEWLIAGLFGAIWLIVYNYLEKIYPPSPNLYIMCFSPDRSNTSSRLHILENPASEAWMVCYWDPGNGFYGYWLNYRANRHHHTANRLHNMGALHGEGLQAITYSNNYNPHSIKHKY